MSKHYQFTDDLIPSADGSSSVGTYSTRFKNGYYSGEIVSEFLLIGTNSISNSKVGIKGVDSSSSNYGLKVQNSGGTDNFVVRNDGNVGIRVSNPSFPLHVNLNTNENILFRSYDSGFGSVAHFQTVNDLNSAITPINFVSSTYYFTGFQAKMWIGDSYLANPTARVHIKGTDSTSSNHALKIDNSSNTPLLYVRDDGNIGIGTASPTTRLHIYATQSGAIRLQDGTQNTGYVLTSDSNGVSTWTQSSNVFNGGTGSFGVAFSKGDGTITTSDTAKVVIPFGGYITGWRILEISSTPISSSIVVDVKKTTYDSYPSSFTSIAGSEKPTLSSAVKNQDTTLTTWTINFDAGDVFEFDVESVTSAKNVSVMLMYVRTINV